MTQEYGKYLTMALISKANDKGMKLKDVAAKVSIPEGVASDWIRGKAAPTDADLEKICEFLECSPAEIKAWVTAKLSKESAEVSQTETKPAETPKTKPENKEVKENPTKEKVITTKEKEILPEPVVDTKETPEEKPRKRANKEKEPTTMKPTTEKKKTVSPAKTEKKLFDEELETIIRKTAGLKKTELITEEALLSAYRKTTDEIKENLETLSKFETGVLSALYTELSAEKVDSRYRELLDAAKGASDEGIAVAITILKKFTV